MMNYILETTKNLLSIPSPTGYTHMAADFVMKELEDLGYAPSLTNKGAVLVDLGGTSDDSDAAIVTVHIDTLGAMVNQIKSNGRLKVSLLGGLALNSAEGENVKIHTRNGKIYDGTFQLVNPAVHVNKDYKETQRSTDHMEVVIDEIVRTAEDVKSLGIMNGDIISFDPKTVITESGFIKSRFLDDKLCCGILLGYAKSLKMRDIPPKKHTYVLFSPYEEVGHGAAAGIPSDVTEILSVDMGCIGEGLDGDETKVSICAKDIQSPYDYHLTSELIHAAKSASLDFAVDVFPYYGSDADAAISAGLDARHGLIGPGVAASHGYERSHVKGIENTLALLQAYLG